MIIVTGASKGLGRVICDRLVSQGEKVLGLARNPVDAPFEFAACDVSDYDALRSVAADLRRRRVPVTGLLNVAGTATMNMAVTTPEEVTRRIVGINLLGTIFSCQNFAPLLIRNQGGCIINFSTIAVALGMKGESIYAASKAGVEGFSRAFAREMAGFGVRVNCIAPGPIKTDLLRGVTDEQIDDIVNQQIIQRVFEPDAVADIVELLLSDKAAAVTGEVVRVGGA
jgi:3-oxoacyl-[acyl-carrier protein] reductase